VPRQLKGCAVTHNNEIPVPIARFSLSPEEACASLGIGMSTLYGLIARGEVESRKLGKRTVIPISSLPRLMDGEPHPAVDP